MTPTFLPKPISLLIAFLSFGLICVSAQQPTSPSKGATGSLIRGRVIYADTGRPLRRAEIRLVSEHGNDLDVREFTDRNGEFILRHLNAGSYIVVVSAPDIVSPFESLGPNDSLELAIATGQIENGFSEVTVDGRSSVKTEIRASRGGVITGRVLSETDEPITKARIKLFHVEKSGKLRPAAGSDQPLREDEWMFQTDSRGVYRIAGLRSGEYVVRATESDEGGNPDDAAEGSYTNGSMVVAFHPKALRAQDAVQVQVQQGSETEADIRFTELNTHRVAGLVVLRGKPAQFAEIQLTRNGPEIERRVLSSEQARTDSDGRWEIRGIPDGEYILSVTGFSSVRLRDEEGYWRVAPQQREVTVAGGDLTDLKMELVEGAMLDGVVSVEGKVKPPYNLIIQLISARPGSGDVVDRSTVSDKSTFSLSPLPAGSFHFSVRNLGNDLYVKAITLKGKDLLREPLKVEAGKLTEGVRIVLSPDLVSLSGRVADKSDRTKPLPGAAVLLIPVEPERRRVNEDQIVARAGKDGRFVVKAAPGEYFVLVLDRQNKDAPVEITKDTDLTALKKIKLEPGDNKRIGELVGP